MISEGVRYGVRTRQNSWFDFQLQHLNFIAAFKSLHSSFRIHMTGKRFCNAWSFTEMAIEKRESVGNTRPLPQAKMLLALLKRKPLYSG